MTKTGLCRLEMRTCTEHPVGTRQWGTEFLGSLIGSGVRNFDVWLCRILSEKTVFSSDDIDKLTVHFFWKTGRRVKFDGVVSCPLILLHEPFKL